MKIWKYIFYYLGVVLLFSFINWVVFCCNSTSFLISEQMNKHLGRYDFVSKEFNLAEFHASTKDLMPVSVDGFVGVVSSKLMRLSEVNDTLLLYTRQLDSLHMLVDSLNLVAGVHRDTNVCAYVEAAMRPYKYKLDSIEQAMVGMDSTDMISNGFLIEESRLQVDYAVKYKDVLDYVFRNLQAFIPFEDVELRNDCFSKIVSRGGEKRSLEQERCNLVRSFQESSSQFHENRRLSVGFFDFLYYSICVSTTVSFGDIAPNNGLTRLFAILELLSCILLVSKIINELNKKRNE